MSTAPFHISLAAADWLAKLPEKPGEELGFVCSPRYRLLSGSEIIESFERDHYSFVHAQPEVWSKDRAAIRVIIDQRPFWLMPEILQCLDSRTLDIVRVDVGQGPHSGRFRSFLITAE